MLTLHQQGLQRGRAQYPRSPIPEVHRIHYAKAVLLSKNKTEGLGLSFRADETAARRTILEIWIAKTTAMSCSASRP